VCVGVSFLGDLVAVWMSLAAVMVGAACACALVSTHACMHACPLALPAFGLSAGVVFNDRMSVF